MTNTSIENLSNKIHSKIIQWWRKRSAEMVLRIKGKRDQSIEILQKRYGYTKEQAAIEYKKHYLNVRLD